jgi:hypothetical protein
LILALDSLCQLASRLAELRVSISDGEDVCPGGRTAQVGRRGVETTPQLARTTTPRVRSKLVWRLARSSSVRRPLKAGGLGLAAGLRLGSCCLRQRREARAEARIRRGEPVCVERLAPARGKVLPTGVTHGRFWSLLA